MQSNFDRSLSAVLKHEGGYVDHPRDPGGATNKGITLANFRRYVKPGGTKADLKKLTTEQAAAVYLKQFWAPLLADQLPAGVDYALFDYGVNSGPARAVKALQALVGAKADGVVGPKTIAAVNAVANIPDLIDDLCAQRLAFVKRLKTWPTFGKGWTSRIAGVRVLALEMARGEPVPKPAPKPVPAPPPPERDVINDTPVGFQLSPLKLALWVVATIAAIWAVNAITSLF